MQLWDRKGVPHFFSRFYDFKHHHTDQMLGTKSIIQKEMTLGMVTIKQILYFISFLFVFIP
jgi:hypothetical protein